MCLGLEWPTVPVQPVSLRKADYIFLRESSESSHRCLANSSRRLCTSRSGLESEKKMDRWRKSLLLRAKVPSGVLPLNRFKIKALPVRPILAAELLDGLMKDRVQ